MIARVEKPITVAQSASGYIEDRKRGVFVVVPTSLKTEEDVKNLDHMMQQFAPMLRHQTPRYLVVDMEGVNIAEGALGDKFMAALLNAKQSMGGMGPKHGSQAELHVAGVGNKDTREMFHINRLENELNVHSEVASEIVRQLHRRPQKHTDLIARLPSSVADEITR